MNVAVAAAMTANRIATQNAVNTALMAAKHHAHGSVEQSDNFVCQVLVGTFLSILLAIAFFGLLCVIF